MLKTFCLNSFDQSNEQIYDMMSYLSIDTELFSMLANYVKHENTEELQELIKNVFSTLNDAEKKHGYI